MKKNHIVFISIKSIVTREFRRKLTVFPSISLITFVFVIFNYRMKEIIKNYFNFWHFPTSLITYLLPCESRRARVFIPSHSDTRKLQIHVHNCQNYLIFCMEGETKQKVLAFPIFKIICFRRTRFVCFKRARDYEFLRRVWIYNDLKSHTQTPRLGTCGQYFFHVNLRYVEKQRINQPLRYQIIYK